MMLTIDWCAAPTVHVMFPPGGGSSLTQWVICVLTLTFWIAVAGQCFVFRVYGRDRDANFR